VLLSTKSRWHEKELPKWESFELAAGQQRTAFFHFKLIPRLWIAHSWRAGDVAPSGFLAGVNCWIHGLVKYPRESFAELSWDSCLRKLIFCQPPRRRTLNWNKFEMRTKQKKKHLPRQNIGNRKHTETIAKGKSTKANRRD
jgi:hypothetical protein